MWPSPPQMLHGSGSEYRAPPPPPLEPDRKLDMDLVPLRAVSSTESAEMSALRRNAARKRYSGRRKVAAARVPSSMTTVGKGSSSSIATRNGHSSLGGAF